MKVGNYINAIEFVEGTNGFRAHVLPKWEKQVIMLKELTWHYVIKNPALETQQHGQRRVISDLFETFLVAASGTGASRNRGIFPVGYQEQLAEAADDKEAVRIVADLIASMTEHQALKMHQRLTGAAPGSVMDII